MYVYIPETTGRHGNEEVTCGIIMLGPLRSNMYYRVLCTVDVEARYSAKTAKQAAFPQRELKHHLLDERLPLCPVVKLAPR